MKNEIIIKNVLLIINIFLLIVIISFIDCNSLSLDMNDMMNEIIFINNNNSNKTDNETQKTDLKIMVSTSSYRLYIKPLTIEDKKIILCSMLNCFQDVCRNRC